MTGKRLDPEEKARRKFARMDQTDARNVARAAICQPFENELTQLRYKQQLESEFLWDKIRPLEEAAEKAFEDDDYDGEARDRYGRASDKIEKRSQNLHEKQKKEYEIESANIFAAQERAWAEFERNHPVLEPLHIAHLRQWRDYIRERDIDGPCRARREQAERDQLNYVPPEKPSEKPITIYATKHASGWLTAIASLFR